MLRKFVSVVTASLLACSAFALSGCLGKLENSEPDFSNAQQVAELATYESYSHNVAKRKDPGLFFDIGKREVWFEYDAVVSYGINANKAEISQPHLNGTEQVVTVKIPKAQVFGRPTLIDNSIVLSAEKRGILVLDDLSADQKTEIINNAQNDLEKKSKDDAAMLEQASDRAKDLLENYVTSIGDALDQEYKIEFEEV